MWPSVTRLLSVEFLIGGKVSVHKVCVTVRNNFHTNECVSRLCCRCVQGHSACWILYWTRNIPVYVTYCVRWQTTKDIMWVKDYGLIEQTLLLVRMGLNPSYITGHSQGRVCVAIHRQESLHVTGSCWCKCLNNKYMYFFIIVRQSTKLWKKENVYFYIFFISYVHDFFLISKRRLHNPANVKERVKLVIIYGENDSTFDHCFKIISAELYINAPSNFKTLKLWMNYIIY